MSLHAQEKGKQGEICLKVKKPLGRHQIFYAKNGPVVPSIDTKGGVRK
jgi:hypothetical protein